MPPLPRASSSPDDRAAPPRLPTDDGGNSATKTKNPSDSGSATGKFPCGQCGAKLVFVPGTRALGCPYCGFLNEIAAPAAQIHELDYQRYLQALAHEQEPAPEIEVAERRITKCDSCAAEIQHPAGAASISCPYCATPIVIANQIQRLLRPQALLPFRVTSDAANQAFAKWLKSLWFAPSGLQRYARIEDRIVGVYAPFWTYDCNTITDYTGMRGDDYYVPVTVTTVVNGRTETRTVMERRTHWTSVSGRVRNSFDDLLVVATRSLPRALVEEIDPWDLTQLEPYRDEFLSGFAAEHYQVGLEDGFTDAKSLMAGPIRRTVANDIGGDHQQIQSLDVDYRNISFKHILLPIWISAYQYRGKTYRFLVNARTGEVQGQRPWSVLKITLTILGAIAIVGGAVYAYMKMQ